MTSAKMCVIRSAARGSIMQAASRSPTRSSLFEFAQRQNAAIPREQAAVKFDHDRLAGSG